VPREFLARQDPKGILGALDGKDLLEFKERLVHQDGLDHVEIQVIPASPDSEVHKVCYRHLHAYKMGQKVGHQVACDKYCINPLVPELFYGLPSK